MCEKCYVKATPVSVIKIEPWGADCMTRIVNDGVFICVCNVKYDEYKGWTKMHLCMSVISNLCINQNVVGLSFIIELMHLFVFVV